MFLSKFMLMGQFFTSIFIKIKVIHTPILINIPSPKLHEIVLVESHPTKEKFAIDFTPIRSRFTTISLFFGRNVPAEVRVRPIPEEMDMENSTQILSFLSSAKTKTKWMKPRSTILRDFLLKAVSFEDFINNNYTMNLYTRNCRHFAEHVKLLYRSLRGG